MSFARLLTAENKSNGINYDGGNQLITSGAPRGALLGAVQPKPCCACCAHVVAWYANQGDQLGSTLKREFVAKQLKTHFLHAGALQGRPKAPHCPTKGNNERKGPPSLLCRKSWRLPPSGNPCCGLTQCMNQQYALMIGGELRRTCSFVTCCMYQKYCRLWVRWHQVDPAVGG